MEVEGVPVGDIRLVKGQCEDDFFGVLVVGGEDILACTLQFILAAVDDTVTGFDTFVVVSVCTV